MILANQLWHQARNEYWLGTNKADMDTRQTYFLEVGCEERKYGDGTWRKPDGY